MKMKRMMKTTKTLSISRETCKDCGATYDVGAPHNAFCAARTCNECLETFGHVLDVWDSRETPPIRYCQECMDAQADKTHAGG